MCFTKNVEAIISKMVMVPPINNNIFFRNDKLFSMSVRIIVI
ncbi:hypothetical protein PESP_a0345 [Pseudoalteromonas espejiana DSM 9414]|nr:hypothetical protein PESP_a0345 [Pseudoalteromonas espejiana DSM 9414]